MSVYSVEPLTKGRNVWGIFNECSWTGQLIQSDLEEREAKILCELLNDLYCQIKWDIETGHIKRAE